MKRYIFLVAVVAIISNVAAVAQKRIDPNSYKREIGFAVGGQGPIGMSDQSLETSFGIDYAQYWNYGLGLKTGFRYQPYSIDLDNWFMVPIAFSWRPKMTSWKKGDALNAAVDALGGLADSYYYWDNEPSVGGWFANFLAQLVNRADFFIGLSPGYVDGTGSVHRYYVTENQEQWKDYGVKKMRSFVLNADAGLTLSCRIWRFTLNMSPAVHYSITDNCHDYFKQNIQGRDSGFRSDPIRWQFSIEGGLRFLF